MRGRSDATLNPGGVRIGTAEIYQQVENIEFIKEGLDSKKLRLTINNLKSIIMSIKDI